VALGIADHAGEQRRLADGELVERLAPHAERRRGVERAEEPPRRRLHAVRALPEVHRVEVLLEDLALRVLVVQAISEDQLLRFPLQVALVAEDPVLDELLRDRRTALTDLPLGQVLEEGTRHAAHVDARALPDGLVLGGDHGVDQDLGHLGELDRLPVLHAQLADLGPVGVVYERRLRELAEALHAARVVVCERDLAHAGAERSQADPEGEAADHDDGREPDENLSRLRHLPGAPPSFGLRPPYSLLPPVPELESGQAEGGVRIRTGRRSKYRQGGFAAAGTARGRGPGRRRVRRRRRTRRRRRRWRT